MPSPPETMQGVRATAQHAELGRTVAGTLRLNDDRLEFSGDDIDLTFPLADLRIHAGGHNNEQLFFQHTCQPDWFVSTSDHSIAVPLSASRSDLRDQLSIAVKSKATSSRLVATALVCIGVLVAIVVLLFSLKSSLAGFVADGLPMSWEQKFGDTIFESVKAEGKIVNDSAWTAQINVVTQRLLRAVTNANYPFQFHVLDAEDLNAFAIPGGHIVVHTGLLKAVERPEELAGVLAHEIAHVTQRHSLRNLVESAGLTLIIQALFGDASGLIAVASGGSEFLLRQKFSRDTEREADDVGWDYLLAANIDPRGMTSFFHRLQKETEKNPAAAVTDGTLNLMSTHPATPERIARLEAKWKELGEARTFHPMAK